jgi:hypothetical protein
MFESSKQFSSRLNDEIGCSCENLSRRQLADIFLFMMFCFAFFRFSSCLLWEKTASTAAAVPLTVRHRKRTFIEIGLVSANSTRHGVPRLIARAR